MLKYTLKRILQVIPVLIIVSFIVFMLVRLMPGDPVRTLLGEDASIETVEAVRHELGLDQPALKQYFVWLTDLFHGELGKSFSYKLPVETLISERMVPTLILAVGAIVVSVVLGIIFGMISAVKHNHFRYGCNLHTWVLFCHADGSPVFHSSGVAAQLWPQFTQALYPADPDPGVPTDRYDDPYDPLIHDGCA